MFTIKELMEGQLYFVHMLKVIILIRQKHLLGEHFNSLKIQITYWYNIMIIQFNHQFIKIK